MTKKNIKPPENLISEIEIVHLWGIAMRHAAAYITDQSSVYSDVETGFDKFQAYAEEIVRDRVSPLKNQAEIIRDLLHASSDLLRIARTGQYSGGDVRDVQSAMSVMESLLSDNEDLFYEK